MQNPLSVLYSFRHTIYATTLNDVRGRYAGSILGIFWAFLYPFLFLSVYALVFTLILGIRLQMMSTFEYILVIFAGLIPFIGFSEALANSTSSVISNKGLLRNTMFPIDLIPVKAVLSSFVTSSIALFGLLVTLWIRGEFHWTQTLMVVVFPLQIIFSIGVGWFVSAMTVFFRDLTHIIGVIIMFLMLVSPIGYTRDMIPPAMMPIMTVNPLYYLIEVYRGIMIYGVVPIYSFLALFLISIAAFTIGYFFFSRLKPVFGEYV
jgi:lipopolysaccharide transport system permease protein